MKSFQRKPVDFAEYLERERKENEIDLGLVFELAEKKYIYNQTPVNTLIEDMETLKPGFFTNVYFSLGEEGELETIRFFQR